MSNWFNVLGDKLVRTDIWVLFISLSFTVSFLFYILCGIGVISSCNDLFITHNKNLLQLMLLLMGADLGIKRFRP